jgi:hypothetical protein
MGILLLLIGVLAAGSGAAKLLAARRTGADRPAFAVPEVVVGAVVILGSGLGLARARPLAWTAVAVAALVIALATRAHVRRAMRARAGRAASEGARLREYVERRST